jgi:hypothetical protein
MRKVWAMTIALMIAAIILTPALGYTLQSAGNQSYTASSGARVNYTAGSGTAAHNLTMEMILAKMNIPGPAVTGSRSPYSIRPGPAVPYSMKLPGVTGVREGYQTKKAPLVVGKTYIETVAQPAAPERKRSDPGTMIRSRQSKRKRRRGAKGNRARPASGSVDWTGVNALIWRDVTVPKGSGGAGEGRHRPAEIRKRV